MLTKLEKYPDLLLQTLSVTIQSEEPGEDVDYNASIASGISVSALDAKLRKFQEMFPGATVTMRITSLIFNRGAQLLEFLKDINEPVDEKYVKLTGE
jgi:hypothetical protein